MSAAAYVIFLQPFNFEFFGSTSGPVSGARRICRFGVVGPGSWVRAHRPALR